MKKHHLLLIPVILLSLIAACTSGTSATAGVPAAKTDTLSFEPIAFHKEWVSLQQTDSGWIVWKPLFAVTLWFRVDTATGKFFMQWGQEAMYVPLLGIRSAGENKFSVYFDEKHFDGRDTVRITVERLASDPRIYHWEWTDYSGGGEQTQEFDMVPRHLENEFRHVKQPCSLEAGAENCDAMAKSDLEASKVKWTPEMKAFNGFFGRGSAKHGGYWEDVRIEGQWRGFLYVIFSSGELDGRPCCDHLGFGHFRNDTLFVRTDIDEEDAMILTLSEDGNTLTVAPINPSMQQEMERICCEKGKAGGEYKREY